MARNAQPWKRKDRPGWYAWVDGKQVKLAGDEATKRQAAAALAKLLEARAGGRPDTTESASLAWVVGKFLDVVNRERSPLTYKWYGRHMDSFARSCGSIGIGDVRPYHVTAWLEAHAWGPTTRSGAITAVKRAFRWAKKEGYLEANALADVEKPRARRREAIPTADQFRAILAATKDAPFRDLLTALWETGSRPGEVISVEGAGVDLEAGTWTVVNKTRHKRDATRVIQLTARMIEVSRRLIAAHPSGPMFRNTMGRPWTRAALCERFRRIREKHGFGPEAVASAMRHVFATDALERGVPIATVAELMGHADTNMVAKIYSKLTQRTSHLREAVAKVRPEEE